MATLKPVSFSAPSEYSEEQESIARRQAMADRLREQSDMPISTGQMHGGWFVPTSPLEGVAKMLRAYTAATQQQDIDKQRKELSQRYQSDLTGTLNRYSTALTGSPEQTNLSPDYEGTYTTPATKPDPQAAARILLGHPATQQMALQRMMQGPIKVGKDERLLDPNSLSQLVGPQQSPPKYHSVGGNLVQEPTTPGAAVKPVFTAPQKPDDLTQALVAAGIDPKSPEAQALFKARANKLATHAPAQSVSVKVDQKTGESLAKEIGPMMSESLAGAQGAVQTVDTVSRIKKAIEGGNLSIGPTATIRQQANQIAQILGVAGKSTEESLVNTREVMRGLAQMAVQARKGLKGQGQVSDYEGKLLQRAEAGEVQDFTIPELKSFVATTERLANLQYKEHQRRVGVMQKNPNLREITPFYEAPAMPQGQPSPQDIVEELKRRGVVK